MRTIHRRITQNMAYLIHFRPTAMTRDQYERVHATLNARGLGGHDLSVTGSPADADHCRVLMPASRGVNALEIGFGPLLGGRRNRIVGAGMAA